MPRLCERLTQPNKQSNSFPASTGQDSCRRAVRIVDIDHNDKSKRHLVHRLGKERPDSIRIYGHAMWELLHFRSNMSPDEIKQIYFQFDKSLWQSLLELDDHPVSDSEIKQALFWHLPCDETDFIGICRGRPFYDSVAVCLCEAHMAYLRQDEPMFVFYIELTGQSFAIFANKFSKQNRRLACIFLVLEGLCLEHALKMTVVGLRNTTEGTEDRAKLFDWHQEWLSRCKLHFDDLSPINQKLFLFWLKDVLDAPVLLRAYDRI